MALKFEKTPGEIWMERLSAVFFSLVVIVGHVVAFFLIVSKTPRIAAAILSIGQCYVAWQGVSRVATGERFTIRFTMSPGQLRELLDVAFSCVLLVNMALFLNVVLNWPVP